jgi:hypothetical protein
MDNNIRFYIKDAEGHKFDPPIKVEYDFEHQIASFYVDRYLSIDIKYTWNNFGLTKGILSPALQFKRLVEFDLAHAFGHVQEDPNYTELHWALYGNLKQYYKGYEEHYYMQA